MTEAPEPPQIVDAMIDLETLGVDSDAAIIQVGVTFFRLLGTGGELPEGASYEQVVNLQSCLFLGGRIDLSTLDWWMRRPVQDRLAVSGEGCSVGHALDTLSAWFARYQPVRTWCHGATFDVPILAGYYQRSGRRPPWRYSDVRDTRTLFETAERIARWKRPERETAHLARADALAQAEDVQSAWAALVEKAG